MSTEEVNFLRQALQHIATTAANSASSTRRTRWIQRRAEMALRGEPYSNDAFDLPKVNTESLDRVKRRLAHAKRLLAAHGIPWEENPKEVARQEGGAS